MSAVDVIVVSYNRRDLLERCCRSVERLGRSARLIVVDNASTDGSVAHVRERFPGAAIIELERNVGFGSAVNRGAAAGTADRLLLLNSDAEIDAEAYGTLAEALGTDPTTAAVGPRIRDSGGALELSTGRVLSPANELAFKLAERLTRARRGLAHRLAERHYGRPRRTRSLSAACLLLRREAFEQVGGFDERFFLYAEDVDLCLRLRRAGWGLRYTPAATVHHVRGGSAGDPLEVERHYRASQLAFYDKHRGIAARLILRSWLRTRYALAATLGAPSRRAHARRMGRWLATRSATSPAEKA